MTFSVLGEAASKIHKVKGAKKAETFLIQVEEGGIDVLEETESIREKAKELFKKSGEKIRGLSLFECLYTSLMQHYGIHQIFSFNENFDKLEVIRVPKKKTKKRE